MNPVRAAVTDQSSHASASRYGVNRRKFLVGGLVAGTGLLTRAGAGFAASDAGSLVTYASPAPDGARVAYPASWNLDSPSSGNTFDSALLYPHQSFALRTSRVTPPIDAGEGGGLPDLVTYPTDAAIMWLMYYDELLEGPPFQELSLQGLGSPSSVAGFDFYVSSFSNSLRSFLLWVWLGPQMSQQTRRDLNASLQSLSVPR